MNLYGVEYWSARELAPLLGYSKWERFEGTIKRAMIACERAEEKPDNHFPRAGKMVDIGSGAEEKRRKQALIKRREQTSDD